MASRTYWAIEYVYNGSARWFSGDFDENCWDDDVGEARRFRTREEAEECLRRLRLWQRHEPNRHAATVTEHMDVDAQQPPRTEPSQAGDVRAWRAWLDDLLDEARGEGRRQMDRTPGGTPRSNAELLTAAGPPPPSGAGREREERALALLAACERLDVDKRGIGFSCDVDNACGWGGYINNDVDDGRAASARDETADTLADLLIKLSSDAVLGERT